MEGEDGYVPVVAREFYKDYSHRRTFSPEIVELERDVTSTSGVTAGSSSSRDILSAKDVYVAVGKDDTDVLKWALDNAVLPGSRVFLVHVFPPITHIPTPVGRSSTSYLRGHQVRFYIKEENDKRRNLLQKYVYLCNNAKVTVDTMLLASSDRAKAIADLIPVLMITRLVIGTKKPNHSRKKKKSSLGEFIRKNAPDYCEVSIVHQGNKVIDDEKTTTSRRRGAEYERSIYEWACFPGNAWEKSANVLSTASPTMAANRPLLPEIKATMDSSREVIRNMREICDLFSAGGGSSLVALSQYPLVSGLCTRIRIES